MNYNTRELAYFGGGGLVAVLCLLLPVGIAGKIILGGVVVVGSLVLALAPVPGKGNLKIDRALLRKWKKSIRPLLYSRHGGGGIQNRRCSKNVSDLDNLEYAPAPEAALTPIVEPQTASTPPASTPLPATLPMSVSVRIISVLPADQDGEPYSAPEIIRPAVLSKINSDEIRPGSIVTYVMIVISIYVLYWLWTGGMQNISALLTTVR